MPLFSKPSRWESSPTQKDKGVRESVAVTFTPLQAEDRPQVERLLFHAFGPDRRNLPSYELRQGPPLDRLSWVARGPGGDVLGCLRFWQVCLSSSPISAALLGPLAVDRAYRGAGVARALIGFGLNHATDLGVELCFVVGEPRLYRNFGFTSAAWSNISCEAPIPPRRLQVHELREGALSGLIGASRLTASSPV